MFDNFLVFLAKHPRIIPEPLLRGLFLCAADICWLLHIGGVQQLERNLRHVLESRDGSVSQTMLRKTSHKGMRSYFTYFAEAMTVGGQSDERLLARARPIGPGLPICKELVHDNPGSAPMAISHQGNWDYEGFLAADVIAPVTVTAERLKNQKLLDVFIEIRKRMDITVLLTGQPHLIEKLEGALAKPHVLVPLLADRDLSRYGEFVHAFGSTIRVARGPATLALDTGKPLFVVNMFRERLHGEARRKAGIGYGYVVDLSAPIDVAQFRGLPREEAIHAISQAWVDVWSRDIAAHPEDWHMLQPIFIEDLDMSRLKDVPDDVLAELRQINADDNTKPIGK
ncbi:phosphatidylinositol mannoside acyltransferase [Bifidobacterium sp. ESL0704]|uniref:phosphatidylinositol mannoside acyltransferase n=1 Tax=Bifidobacterium sp. ESL0704 TaxID=2983219 RepID=UPI0023F9B8DE|nr:phosphatidylinositol mannoside acyltransferase [Bifidobacterium sp. ESL0704]WEV52259.1 phosphatidylinositol mannoside acyltransferase [Bifidobacterium sp. ESL0704]